jgi:Lrp/AsnC family transcriptional regulator
MDKFDQAILSILQTDCTRPIAEIADRVGLGSTAGHDSRPSGVA